MNWDAAGAANNYGYITTMQDPNNPTGKHILDPAHSKNVNKFKVVLCDDPDLTPAGVESCAYRPGESLATCIDLAFIPRYSEPQYSTIIADNLGGIATINSWCGPGYNMAGFEQRDARFVSFK